MLSLIGDGTRRWRLCALALGCVVCAAGCGSSTHTGSQATGTSAAATTSKPIKIAFLDGITANPYVQASIGAMQTLAKQDNVRLTIIDSQFDPQTQFSQLQDIVASDQYQGVVVLPLDGVALESVVKRAIAEGIKVGATDEPLGPNNTTTKIQVPGVSVTVLRPFSVHGEIMGKLANQACSGNADCQVAFVIGSASSPFDQQLLKSFKQTLDSNVHVVAVSQGDYSRAGGQTAVATILQAHPDINVLATVDQSAVGAATSIKAAGRAGKIKIIGYGGTTQAKTAIEDGQWYGDSASMPATEGRLALQGVITAIRTGKVTGGLDAVSVAHVPDDGMITKANVAQFHPQYSG